ncbi:hypothetical protein KFK09_022712 [Dendrobium nobile]|uniref:Uncharacterized protein n=1 Tax=Dendrobium nobile TaxID=94219 RepID=A0A8T3AIK8_DENNO|nr:hypothetical protein KFK09_022712 [Dendrobium nobile]
MYHLFPLLHRIIVSNKTDFMNGRSISNNILLAQEIQHCLDDKVPRGTLFLNWILSKLMITLFVTLSTTSFNCLSLILLSLISLKFALKVHFHLSLLMEKVMVSLSPLMS